MSRKLKVLVTGASGFVGRVVQRAWPDIVAWPQGADLTSPRQVEKALELVSAEDFDSVLHLAAQANPRLSKEDASRTWMVNLMGTVHLLEALGRQSWRGRFLYVSSGAVYGGVSGRLTEASPLKIDSPYVASKIAAETAALEWGRRTGAEAIVVRPFNHSGPGQSQHYFLPSMAAQISALDEAGGVIDVGNLEVQRDFLHVDDVVAAYRLLLLKGRNQEIYNLASGHSLPLEKLLHRLAQKCRRVVTYRVDQARFRAENSQSVKVDLSKIQEDTGWRPKQTVDSLLQSLADFHAP